MEYKIEWQLDAEHVIYAVISQDLLREGEFDEEYIADILDHQKPKPEAVRELTELLRICEDAEPSSDYFEQAYHFMFPDPPTRIQTILIMLIDDPGELYTHEWEELVTYIDENILWDELELMDYTPAGRRDKKLREIGIN